MPPIVVAHPFTGTLPERDAFDLVADVGATAYFPGVRIEIEGRAGVLVDLRVTTTGEDVADLPWMCPSTSSRRRRRAIPRVSSCASTTRTRRCDGDAFREHPARTPAFLAEPPMPFLSAIAAASPRHDGTTEDRVAVHQLGEALVIVVADGAGGIPGGGVAVDAVARGIADAIANEAESFQRVDGVVALLRRLDDDIERMPLAGETTAVIVIVTEHGVFGASCGDSGAWIVEEVGLDDLTADQRRTLRLGSGRTVPVPFVRAGIGGTLVVASDGLFNFTRPETICSNARGISLSAAACGLVAAVRTASGDLMDDVAVAVVRGK